VRRTPGAATFQQRFEYIVQGVPADVSAFVASAAASGAVLSEQRTVAATAYALVLSPVPVTVPAVLSGVSFRDLRAGDLDGTLSLQAPIFVEILRPLRSSVLVDALVHRNGFRLERN
jgi:hypothetical protein